jgi:hypothetical protein
MVSVPANTAARQSDATGTSRDSPPEWHGRRLLLLLCDGEVEWERWKQRFRCARTVWFPSPPTGRPTPAALRPRYIRLTKLKAPKDQKKLAKGVGAPRGFPAVFL